MNKCREIPSIVENHVQRLISRECSEGLLNTPQILFLGLSFPRKDRNASGSDAVPGK
jgi:hypothetical protein